VGNAAGELHDLDAALQLPPGVGKDLSVFTGNDAGEFGGVGLQQLTEAEHHAGALERRPRRPLGERALA
jgi:hypothetical protein